MPYHICVIMMRSCNTCSTITWQQATGGRGSLISCGEGSLGCCCMIAPNGQTVTFITIRVPLLIHTIHVVSQNVADSLVRYRACAPCAATSNGFTPAPPCPPTCSSSLTPAARSYTHGAKGAKTCATGFAFCLFQRHPKAENGDTAHDAHHRQERPLWVHEPRGSLDATIAR